MSKEMNYATTMVSHSIELLQVYPCVFHLKGLVQASAILEFFRSAESATASGKLLDDLI